MYIDQLVVAGINVKKGRIFVEAKSYGPRALAVLLRATSSFG